jgi:hypothetical protein
VRARAKGRLVYFVPHLSGSRCATDPNGAHDTFATCPLRRTSRITIRYLSCATRRNIRRRPARQRTVDRITFYVGQRLRALDFRTSERSPSRT